MNRHPPRAITPAEIDAYQRDGAICLRGLFDRDWVERLRAAIERVRARPGPLGETYGGAAGDGGFYGDRFIWTFDDDFRALALESPAGAIAAALMRAEAVHLYCDHLLVKEPGTSARTPWHHDLQAWPIEGAQIISLWLSLDRVTAESGNVEYIAGSHRWGRRFRSSSFGRAGKHGGETYGAASPADDPYEDVPDFDRERERHRFLSWEVEPGDCVAFHALTVHGAPGNATTRRRRAISLRLAGDDVLWFARPGKTAKLIRETGLAPGDRLDRSDLFPVIWRRGQAMTTRSPEPATATT